MTSFRQSQFIKVLSNFGNETSQNTGTDGYHIFSMQGQTDGPTDPVPPLV